MITSLIAEHLGQTELFRGFSPEQMRLIARRSEVRHVSEGETVYRKGDEADFLFLVVVGEIELVLESEDGAQAIVGKVSTGGHFGETSFFTEKARSLSARAVCDGVLICFSYESLRALIASHGVLRERLEKMLAERLRVSFQNQADGGAAVSISSREKDQMAAMLGAERGSENGADRVTRSQHARDIQAAIGRFAKTDEPILLTGEPGTGRRMIAKQIHLHGNQAQGPYLELDVRDYNGEQLIKKLFGVRHDSSPFARTRQTGVLEQFSRGTIVLLHTDKIPLPIQKKLAEAVATMTFTPIGGDNLVALQARLIFSSNFSLEALKKDLHIIKNLEQVLAPNLYHVQPLRFHKRDIPYFIGHFLNRFNLEYGKTIKSVSPETLGILMNYDWPGNLTELATVIQRAVMLNRGDELRSDHILLGLPKSEGKWEFNLLRLGWVRAIMNSKLFPALPRAIVGIVLLVSIGTLLLGPENPEENIGITLSWVIGWPLLFFSFFFLARLWCSVCTLAMPGHLLQKIIKPTRQTPLFIKRYSGWIMAALCIAVMWVEIVWNAYRNPVLSAWIILAVTAGSMIFSVFFRRRTWCRYLCPLGAINAIFAMPAVLEVRSNRHLCMNQCSDHACYAGDNDEQGCPMFRHPFMVDNNRDCIVCGQCMKSCTKQSIQLNVRMAPQELWNIEIPRRADSFLIVSLGAIFFPFALHEQFYGLATYLHGSLPTPLSFIPWWAVATMLFFALIAIFQIGYYLMALIQARLTNIDRATILPLMGYGFIPIILGVYLAVHFELFVGESWRLVANVRDIIGRPLVAQGTRLLSPDASALLQVITVVGGFLASLYAIHRITERLKGSTLTKKDLVLPYSFLTGFAALFVFFMKSSRILFS
jgi:transcriptional regulator with AAA-type ATPase domain/NAD-dependent dihydropyrimidine dehydrogenase PreA subunit